MERRFKKQGTENNVRSVITDDYVIGVDQHDVVAWNKLSGEVVKRLVGHTHDAVGVTVNPGNLAEFASFGWDNSFIMQVDRVVFNLLDGAQALFF
jgi:hypothetical protein